MKELEELGIPIEETKEIYRRVWNRVMRNLGHFIMGAIPEEEPHCEHHFGPGYCPHEDCPFS